MKNIIGFLLASLLISCQQKNEQIVKVNNQNQVQIQNKKSNELDEIPADKAFFSVYDLSKKTTAIVVNLNGKNTYNGAMFNKVFNEVSTKDSIYKFIEDPTAVRNQNLEYYDTLGVYKLTKNKSLENQIKKIIQPSYYVYGTKGFSKINIKNVVYAIDECFTNIIAFPIENFDTTKNGKPIFCSSKLLAIEYRKNYSDIEKKVQEYDEKENKKLDYKDDIKTKIFANIGDAYFSYNDDFVWGKDFEKRKSKFPKRTIYIVKKDKPINKFWVNGLDLLGINCI